MKFNNTKSNYKNQEAVKSRRENLWANVWKDQTMKTLRKEEKESSTNSNSSVFQTPNQKSAQFQIKSQTINIEPRFKSQLPKILDKITIKMLLKVPAWKSISSQWILILIWIQKTAKKDAFLYHCWTPKSQEKIKTILKNCRPKLM